ncbi:hypothetical protein [Streptomyces aureocirculatus]|uniref:hypothetical protein n=1 Tax=Streptomyces aureocirculatus TaxID=67275 RepID=UPI0006893B44|nr:hypothetical protein [Streptomyces aureocirculatus]
MFDSPDFDLAPYADVDTEKSVRRTYCSWHDAGWRSLLVQCFTHADEAAELPLPGVSDLHLVLCTRGDADMRTRSGGRADRGGTGAGGWTDLCSGPSTPRSARP